MSTGHSVRILYFSASSLRDEQVRSYLIMVSGNNPYDISVFFFYESGLNKELL